VLLRVKWRHVWYGVETQSVLHLKALSFTKEEVSLTLSLSLYEEREKKALFFSSIVERCRHTPRKQSRSVREQRESIGIGNYPRAETSLEKSKSS
jgi:hypothetical protein